MRPQYTWITQDNGDFNPKKIEYHRKILPTVTALRSYIRRAQTALRKEQDPQKRKLIQIIIDEYKTLSEQL